MIRRFTVLRADRANDPEKTLKPGDTVFGLRGHDYGLASDDSRHFGIDYTSVTLKADGDYPGFTIPAMDLRLTPLPRIVREDGGWRVAGALTCDMDLFKRAALWCIERNACPNNLMPDGPVCPSCGEPRGPSGVDGGSWVHLKDAWPASHHVNPEG